VHFIITSRMLASLRIFLEFQSSRTWTFFCHIARSSITANEPGKYTGISPLILKFAVEMS
jgi:hypothetical protein